MVCVIEESRVGARNTVCVDACPVDRIHPKKKTIYSDGCLSRPALRWSSEVHRC